MPGIPKKNPEALIPLLREAATAIAATPGWPPMSPTPAQCTAMADLLAQNRVRVQAAEAELRISRSRRRDDGAEAYAMLQRIDLASSVVHGPTAMAKTQYGVEPHREPGAPPRQEPLRRVVIRAIGDGVGPGSLFADFEAIEGAVYEVQWSLAANFDPVLGGAAVTASRITIPDLVKGNQYWIRARAVRGGESGPWSDPATRIANL